MSITFRYQTQLQSSEIRVHAEEMTRLRNELESETARRTNLEDYIRSLHHLTGGGGGGGGGGRLERIEKTLVFY